MYSLTIFKSIYDNKTHRRMNFSRWEAFKDFLYKLSEQKIESKKDAQLISPATYLSNTTRANANVVNWANWTAVDVDDHVFKGNLKDELFNRFGDYTYICYSTASSSIDHPKFRLVFPLSKEVENSKIRHFWFSLNKELSEIGDGQTKDLSRMYYIPANYSNANNFIFNNVGSDIDPDKLMSKHSYEVKSGSSFKDRMPKHIADRAIEYEKNKLDNTDVRWTGYRDCPFVNKRQIHDWFDISGVDNSGRYAMIYKIMVSTAGNAMQRGYPISAREVAWICSDLDNETGGWYGKRDMTKEAERAIDFVFRNNI